MDDEAWRPIFPDEPLAPPASAGPAPSAAASFPSTPAAGTYGPPPAAQQWTPPPPFQPQATGATEGDALFSPAEIAARAAERAGIDTGELEFRSSRRLALVTSILLGVAGIVAAVMTVHYIAGVELQGRLNRLIVLQPDADAYNQDHFRLAILELVVMAVCSVVFLRWLWRTRRNAPLLGADYYYLTSPRGAVTAWLIPIRNLWKPYQVVSELHERLLLPLESRSGQWLVRLWWLFWLAGTVVGWALSTQTASVRGEDGAAARLTITALLALSGVLRVADAVLAIAVVRQMQRLSDAREAARRGYPAAAMDLVTRSQRRRVTLLPFVLAGLAIAVLAAPLGVTLSNASAATPWQAFAPDSRFSVDLPGKPVEQKLPAGSGNSHSYRIGANLNQVFVVTYYDYPAGALDDAETSLQQLLDAIPTFSADTTRKTTIDGRPALRVSGPFHSLYLTAILCIDGNRVYIVEVDSIPSKAGSADVNRFLESFHLK